VDRLFDSGDATRWYNLAANKNNPDAQVNPNYFSAEKNDVKPTYDQTVPDIRLKTAKVKVTGRVTARTGGAGIANVWVYYWRQDNNDSGYVQTNGTGYYTMYLARSLTSSDTKTWYNLAANKDNGDARHPKNPDWTTADSNNLVPSGDRTGINMVLDSGWVTLSGKVTSPTGAGIPGIWVYYWRQDNNHAGYVGTDGQGAFSIRVPKFLSGDTYRYNLAANKDNGDPDHPKNRDWTTASYDNLMPSTDRPGLTLRLDSGRVTFWGRVKDGSGNYLSGIWVYYWRHDNNDAGYVQTNSTGHYTLTVYKYPYSDDSKWYNLAANKDNGDGKYTNGYETKEIVNVAPDVNRGYKDFTLLSSRVRVTGRVTAQSGGRGLSGIWVYYWRHDGSDADYAVTDGNGYYTMHLLRGTSGNRDSWYNLAANKNNGDPDHPWNPAYAMVEKNDRIPSGDLTVDFPLPSRTG
jgi:TPR repeat protein